MDVELGAYAQALVYTNVNDVIFHLRVEGDRFRFLHINPAFTRTTGLRPEAVVGKFVDEVIPMPSLTLVLTRYRAAIAERRTVRWEEVTDYPSGRKIGEVSVTPVFEDGRCTQLVGTVSDVTEAYRSTQALAGERRALHQLASNAPLADILTTIVRMIEELEPTMIASIVLLDETGTRLRQGAAPRLPEAYNRAIDGAPISAKAGSCGTAAFRGEPVYVEDINIDPLWEDYRELARMVGMRACWSTPILSNDRRVLGTFALYDPAAKLPTPEHIGLIARATHIAAIVIQRRWLDEQLRALTDHIEAVREDERTGIAREIHDELGQALTALKLDLAWIGRRVEPASEISVKLTEMTAMTDAVIQSVRRISAELRPGILDDVGLAAAVEWQAANFHERTNIPCVVTCELGQAIIDRPLATAVFRIFQEALTNVARHAAATHVEVLLYTEGGNLHLEVNDDGIGVSGPDTAHGLGLLGMRERARRVGGECAVTRREPRGTQVLLTVPISPRA